MIQNTKNIQSKRRVVLFSFNNSKLASYFLDTSTGQGSALQQLFERPFDVHAVSDSSHSQLCKVLLGKSREVRAFDLVFLKPCSVLPQVDALQPVSNIVLIPQV